MPKFFSAIAIVIMLLKFNTYIRVPISQDRIVINNYFGITEHEFDLKEIKSIVRYDILINKKRIQLNKSGYEIEMKEGFYWDSNESDYYSKEQIKALCEFLGEKTGLGITKKHYKWQR